MALMPQEPGYPALPPRVTISGPVCIMSCVLPRTQSLLFALFRPVQRKARTSFCSTFEITFWVSADWPGMPACFLKTAGSVRTLLFQEKEKWHRSLEQSEVLLASHLETEA